MIRENKLSQISSMMQTGARSGMRTLDKHLQVLFTKGLLKEEDVLDNATDRAAMSRFLSRAPSQKELEDNM